MSEVGRIPEQTTQTTTEASNAFLDKWGKGIGLGLSSLSAVTQGYLLHVNWAQGDTDVAVLSGITLVASVLTGALQGASIIREARSQKNNNLPN